MSYRQSTYLQFTEEVHFLLPDTHVCMYFMDGHLQCVKHKTFFKRKSDRKKIIFCLGYWHLIRSGQIAHPILIGRAGVPKTSEVCLIFWTGAF